MKFTIMMLCLIGAVFANPISYNAVSESNELDSNSTESLSVSQSSENDTSELQSSEESASSQSQSSQSESESLESTSEDKTSEESNSQSDEDDGTYTMTETRDDSMGSEENVRKSWVRVFASVVKVLSAEDNSSTEVKGKSDHLTEKQPTDTSTSGTNTNLPLVENPTDSADTSESVTASDSSDSTSSESSESNETSEASDSNCVNGTQSCESEEYLFQDIGDDAHYSVDNLMVPDEDERELSLRR
ncbi:secretory calcium-binding phosphoprotein 1 [Perca flavescens]|uniref:secretory calcium-binding phosphoprotein 1 n=1 Tax=Perca flavescens TaxID=8167 RepID=UPI00106E3210|nr:lisH domain-containing protein C1711.05-like [Perca flavescens]